MSENELFKIPEEALKKINIDFHGKQLPVNYE